ncbi:MAG: 3'-5' exonuclease, partial [Bifidobacterium sp.]
ASDIQQAQEDALRTHQPHNKARKSFVRAMMHSLTNRYAEQLDYAPEQSELSHATSVFRMNDDVRKTLNLAWLPMNAVWLISDMWAKPQHLRRFAPWLSEDQIRMLTRAKGSAFTASDIPLLDEAMDVLGPDPKADGGSPAQAAQRARDEQIASETLGQAGIGNGIVTSQMLVDQMTADDDETMVQRAASDREWTYGHIVVDEAQELTAMDWRMLVRRCPSRSFTIVGDIAQTSALGGSRSWQKTMNPLFGERNWTLNELTINYRNPKEVSELSSGFARQEGLYISTVNAVRAIPDSVQRIAVPDRSSLGTRILEALDGLMPEFVSSDGSGRIAIIADGSMVKDLTDLLDAYIATRISDDDRSRLQSQHSWDRQINVYTTDEVKGLEFDAVVLVEPGLMENGAPSRIVAASDLYVSMTRPTQRLVIIRTQQDTDDLPL